MNISHHAYLLIGNIQTRDQLILMLEKKHKIVAQGNPDFFMRNYETFTIDDAREIKALHSMRPVDGDRKFFVLTMNGVTVEAQNAMLKLLEEPAEYAHFFLIIPSVHLLLPTVKSRMREFQISIIKKQEPTEAQEELKNEAVTFLKMNQTKRLDIVKKLIEEISKEKKTKQDAIDFVNVVQEIVYKEKGVKNGRSVLDAIEIARNYLNDRAPSIKMLLEYMALNV